MDYWLELVRDLDAARISTIHSFCGSLLRAHAVEAGIDPRFRVLDGAQADTLLFELTDDVLRDRLAERDEAALALVTRFGLDRLREMIARLLAVRQEIDWPAWRGETPEGLAARWEEFWRRDTVPRVLRQIGESAAARTVLDLAMRYPPAQPKMRERCDFLLRDSCPSCRGASAGERGRPRLLAAIREAAKVQGGGTKKHWGNEEVYEQFRDAAKALRDAIDGVEPQMHSTRRRPGRPPRSALQVLALAADVAEQYDRKKQELGVLDFDDLLIRARELLARPGARRRCASGWPRRSACCWSTSSRTPIRCKSSWSRPCATTSICAASCSSWATTSSRSIVSAAPSRTCSGSCASEMPAAGRLPLSLNFRSQPAVLDFVNALFCEELGPDYEPLRPHRPQVGPTPAVEFLWAGRRMTASKRRGAAGRCQHDSSAPLAPPSPG